MLPGCRGWYAVGEQATPPMGNGRRNPHMATEQVTDATAARIGRIESAVLQEPIWRSRDAAPIPLADLMAQQGVPGVSVAVIHEGALEWARGYGVREAGLPGPVTPDTLFQV